MGTHPCTDPRQCRVVRTDILQQIFNLGLNLSTFLGSFSDSEITVTLLFTKNTISSRMKSNLTVIILR